MNFKQTKLEDNKKHFTTFLKLLPEKFINDFVDCYLWNAYYPVKFNKIIQRYNDYSKEILSEFTNIEINNAWKNFNISFNELIKFLIKHFSIPNQHYLMYKEPPYFYLETRIHHKFNKQTDEISQQWDRYKNELDKTADKFKKTYTNFIEITNKKIKSGNLIKSPIKIINSNIHFGDKVGHDKNINPKFNNSNKYFLSLILAIISGVIIYVITEGKVPKIFKIDTPAQLIHTENNKVATSTLNISDLFIKALSYNTVAERQDFLNKYINIFIYGEGNIKEVSRAFDKLLIEVKIENQSIICPQEKTEKLEKEFPFLKGSLIRFFGNFTYTTYFGQDGMVIDNCAFEKIII